MIIVESQPYLVYLQAKITNSMSEVVVYLPLKPFIRQYVIHHFGYPVRFPDQSITNKCIISVLQKKRKDSKPEVASDGSTAVCIPFSCKDPAVWNFVSSFGKRMICQHIEYVFMMNLWNEMNEMTRGGMKQQDAACEWCSKHGIDIDYADTIRMRYYRDKMQYLGNGIDLRCKTRNRKWRF